MGRPPHSAATSPPAPRSLIQVDPSFEGSVSNRLAAVGKIDGVDRHHRKRARGTLTAIGREGTGTERRREQSRFLRVYVLSNTTSGDRVRRARSWHHSRGGGCFESRGGSLRHGRRDERPSARSPVPGGTVEGCWDETSATGDRPVMKAAFRGSVSRIRMVIGSHEHRASRPGARLNPCGGLSGASGTIPGRRPQRDRNDATKSQASIQLT